MIVEGKRNFGIRLRFALFRAVEYDVLHIRTTQKLCRLFAENPTHGVRHIAFAATVRSDDSRYAFAEFYFELVCEGFESY